MIMRTTYLFFFLFLPVFTHAYLDPGTGSLLVYAVIGILTSLGFLLRGLWYHLIGLFFSTGSNVRGKIMPDLVFHSEGGRYWQVFEPIISACLAKGIPCAYITPDKKDPAHTFENDSGLFLVIRPGSEAATIAYLNKIKTKVVVSTTPGLDVYMWKRSKHVSRYVHIFHAPTSVAFYEKYALSFYDDIFTVGFFQDPEINQLDLLRNLPEKKLYPVGLSYFDYMLKKMETFKRSRNDFTVLYAPTWGLRSSLNLYGHKILDILVQENYRIIFRPHPQSAISDKDIMGSIVSVYKDHPLVEFDYNPTSIAAMANSDLLITDLSGIFFDYAFLCSRPIILTGSEVSFAGYEAEDMTTVPWELEAPKQFSHDLKGNIESIPAVISEIRTMYASAEDNIMAFRDRNICNFGNAGEAAASQLDYILRASL